MALKVLWKAFGPTYIIGSNLPGVWLYRYQIMKRGVMIYAYANNHFQGHGPATVAKSLELWAASGFGKIATPERIKRQHPSLFPPLD
jgi:hypothetical protein